MSGVLEQLLANMIEQALPRIIQEVQARMGTQQVQPGTPAQQAFGNPGGMAGAVHGQQAQAFQQPGQYGGQQAAYDPNANQYSPHAAQPGQQGYSPPPPVTQYPGPAVQPAGNTVTPEMIQSLIMPLVQHEPIKQALTAQMQAMGIQNLPDAQPHQLPELYQRFQAVAQQFGGGAVQNPGAPAPSII